MIGLFLAVGSATLVAGVLGALALQLLPTVRLQLVALAMLAVGLPLAAVSVSGLAMFHGGPAQAILVVSSASALAALAGAALVERRIMGRLQRLRAASSALAAGELAARAPRGGPAELAELAASFNIMAQNLEDLFDARRDLVTWASHDLRAPVTSIRAMLEALEDGLANTAEYLPPLQEQVRLLEGRISELFEMARIDSGATQDEIKVVDLVALIETCAGWFEAAARGAGITLRTDHFDGDLAALCAPEKVERVVSNLITNALQHTPAGGEIRVSAAKQPGAILVAVSDTGCGIPLPAQARVFEPFWRADTARSTASSGSGLGLTISKGLIEAQGGRIWVDPAPSRGARIYFLLPAAPGTRRQTTSASPHAKRQIVGWRPAREPQP
ncbi:MAG: HAMP domain-containing sensor histidine kinase [Candidatus Dormiibacterota bacterium]